MDEWEIKKPISKRFDIMLPMPGVVGWTRNVKFIIGWLKAYVEATDLGVNP